MRYLLTLAILILAVPYASAQYGCNGGGQFRSSFGNGYGCNGGTYSAPSLPFNSFQVPNLVNQQSFQRETVTESFSAPQQFSAPSCGQSFSSFSAPAYSAPAFNSFSSVPAFSSFNTFSTPAFSNFNTFSSPFRFREVDRFRGRGFGGFRFRGPREVHRVVVH